MYDRNPIGTFQCTQLSKRKQRKAIALDTLVVPSLSCRWRDLTTSSENKKYCFKHASRLNGQLNRLPAICVTALLNYNHATTVLQTCDIHVPIICVKKEALSMFRHPSPANRQRAHLDSSLRGKSACGSSDELTFLFGTRTPESNGRAGGRVVVARVREHCNQAWCIRPFMALVARP